MTTTRRQLAELDRLTTALRDGTEHLARDLAAIEAVAYPTRKAMSPRRSNDEGSAPAPLNG